MLNKKAGFTIIELIMVMVFIAAIISASSPMANMLIHFVQHTIYMPREMNAQQAAGAAMDIMIEGDDKAKGLRFAKEIKTAKDDSITFTNYDDEDIEYRIRNVFGWRLQRKIGSPSTWENIPYYAIDDLVVTSQDGGLFSYFDENENPLTAPVANPDDNVRRVQINLSARTGAGSIGDFDSQIRMGSSVKIYKFGP